VLSGDLLEIFSANLALANDPNPLAADFRNGGTGL
jgi:hypothetical protein